MKKKKIIETTGIVNNGKIIYLDVSLPCKLVIVGRACKNRMEG